MPLKVLSALDSARIQFYHFKAIIVAGMGLFTDAYDLFCIPPILKILERIYYHNPNLDQTLPAYKIYEIPKLAISAMLTTALLGTIIGQLIFGRLGDRMGRRRVYGVSLMIMVLSSIGCGFSICRTHTCVLMSLGFFRFFLGVGIGGDYPLSATIISEFANKMTRGSFIAMVFSMQGFGILAGSVVTMVVCRIFEVGTARSKGHDLKWNQTPADADIAWRIILMLGAIPAALTFYWRMLMPETARYTALVENNVQQAAKDMEKVLQVSLSQIAEDSPYPPNPHPYSLLSAQFLHRHGTDLFSSAANWLLLDIVFYSSSLFQSLIYRQYLKLDYANVFHEAFLIAFFQTMVALAATIPGYFVAVYLIDRVGRRKIQMIGFFCMGILYFTLGGTYSHWVENENTGNKGFLVLYGLTFFFANAGPNTTTFIVPAELFPARFRSTCHGISGAMGKLGAFFGTLGFLWVSREEAVENGLPDRKRMKFALIGLGVVCLLGVGITYFFTRETMGISLEENEKDDEDENGYELAVPSRRSHSQSSHG